MAAKKSVKKKKSTSTGKKKTSNRKSGTRGERTSSEDIVSLILQDHKPLKQLIKIMKSSERDFSERQQAFAEFAPLLVAHAKPEEWALYSYMKDDEEMRSEAFEGDVEHGLADQMAEEAKRTDDQDVFSAKIKVLAELVEHHIKEEEEDLLPDFKKHASAEEREILGRRFIAFKNQIESEGSDDAPTERTTAPQIHA
jgi:hemerythrin superfamily protein